MPSLLRNYRFIFKLIATLAFYFFINTASFADLPAYYQSLNAKEKQNLLWSEIQSSHAEDPYPTLSGKSFSQALELLRGLFNLKPSFDYASDEIPAGRIKIIHANGVAGKISFIPTTDHPFTGLYKTGAIGMARLSLATPPSDTDYVPGIAIKFLIPNHPSLNLHAIYLLEGQNGNWNFFANNFSNQIPHPTSWTLKAIEKIFEWTRSPANDLPLSHVASWTNDGKYVGNIVYPERIYLKPADRVKKLIPEDSREDFRKSLSKVSTGPLYEVYGEYKNSEYHIGTIMLKSALLASNYGDKVLFFQHQR